MTIAVAGHQNTSTKTRGRTGRGLVERVPELGDIRVFVAAGNPTTREQLERSLSVALPVQVFSGAAEMLARLGDSSPDVVIVDLDTPGLDVAELVRELRSVRGHEDVPVLLIDGQHDEAVVLAGLEAGAADYLRMPVSPRILQQRVRYALAVARFGREVVNARQDAADARVLAGNALAAHEDAVAVLHSIARRVDEAGDFPAPLNELAELIRELVGAERVAFWVLEGDELRTEGISGFSDDLIARMTSVPCADDGETTAARIEHSGVLLSDRTANVEQSAYRAWLESMGVRDMVGVRWSAGQRGLGALVAYDSTAPDGFTPRQARILGVAALAAALVWQLKQSENAVHDEQRAETESLRSHAQRMEELEQMKRDFLNLAAHELRGPLTVARGYLSMVEEGAMGPLDQADVHDILPVIMGKLAQMNQLINEMLETARLEDRKPELAVSLVDLRDIVRSVVADAEAQRDAVGRVRMRLEERPLLVAVDAARITTVVNNLVDNALKYSPEGGEVLVETAADGARQAATVTVTDSGLGIDMADMPRLFQRFGRILTRENGNIAGTGLGLFLSQELAHLHGGEIVAESEAGVGSRFTLSLPLAGPRPRTTVLGGEADLP
ncbi:MAG TPA: ATP-binding protein [Candidatus Acidoferrales bacterium]|nr:ATP-binding protein [Candidatus Acidoferrales bacterium]